MDNGFLAVISFLMGSIVAGSFLGLGYLRDIRRGLKQLNQSLDDQNAKLDCIAEWLINQDSDCYFDSNFEDSVENLEVEF